MSGHIIAGGQNLTYLPRYSACIGFYARFSTVSNHSFGELPATEGACCALDNDVFYSSYLPISENRAYDRFAQQYNSTRIITDRGLFNETACARKILSSLID